MCGGGIQLVRGTVNMIDGSFARGNRAFDGRSIYVDYTYNGMDEQPKIQYI